MTEASPCPPTTAMQGRGHRCCIHVAAHRGHLQARLTAATSTGAASGHGWPMRGRCYGGWEASSCEGSMTSTGDDQSCKREESMLRPMGAVATTMRHECWNEHQVVLQLSKVGARTNSGRCCDRQEQELRRCADAATRGSRS